MKQRHIVCMIGLIGLSACSTYSLEKLRQVTPQGTPFQKALARHYKEFASSEEKQYDWADSWHFADKGLMAAYGKDVQPELLSSWNVSRDNLPALERARTLLMEVLDGGARESNPEIAARAQYYFDCWVEQQEEAWQEKDISYCRDGFHDTMDTLTGVPMADTAGKEVILAEKPQPAMPDEVYQPEPEPESEPEPMSMAMAAAQPVRPHSYIVFFEKKETAITVSGQKAIEEVITQFQMAGPFEVVLNGHTDTVGDGIENQKLTEERAQIVREELVRGGISESAITIFAFGESDPPVRTADNVAEPANQRVEIFLNE